MWRALFLALGISCCIIGAECLAIEKAVLVAHNNPTADNSADNRGPQREIVPPEWAPWSLMAGGTVVVLYSFTIPKKLGG